MGVMAGEAGHDPLFRYLPGGIEKRQFFGVSFAGKGCVNGMRILADGHLRCKSILCMTGGTHIIHLLAGSGCDLLLPNETVRSSAVNKMAISAQVRLRDILPQDLVAVGKHSVEVMSGVFNGKFMCVALSAELR